MGRLLALRDRSSNLTGLARDAGVRSDLEAIVRALEAGQGELLRDLAQCERLEMDSAVAHRKSLLERNMNMADMLKGLVISTLEVMRPE